MDFNEKQIGFNLSKEKKEGENKSNPIEEIEKKEGENKSDPIEEIEKKLSDKAIEMAEYKSDDWIKLISPKEKIIVTENFIFYENTIGKIIQPVAELKDGNDMGNIFMTFVKRDADIEVNKYKVALKINDKVWYIAEVDKKNIQKLPKEELKQLNER